MRKNLFLTLALLVVAFATAGAQTWQQYLTAMDGLPGGTLNESTNVEEVKTGLITPTSPIEGLRITVLQNKSGAKFGNYPFTTISEIVVLDGDGNQLSYTAGCNAVQTNDGQGLPALNDEDPATYLHTSWSGTDPNEHHYIELTFEAPVSSFRLMWGNRQGNPKDAIKVAALTAVGVAADTIAANIPAIEEGAFTFKGNQLSTLEALEAAEYVVLWGKADEGEYSDNTFMGSRYYAGAGVNADERLAESETPTAKFASKLIDTGDGDGTYYLYSPELKTYLAQNTIADGNNQRDMSNWATEEYAAKLKITENNDSEGTFLLTYATTFTDAGTATTGYVLPDQRDRGLKVVGELSYSDLTSDSPQYPEGQYKLPGYFQFKFFECSYAQPSYIATATLNPAIFDGLKDIVTYGGKQDIENEDGTTYYEELVEAIEAAQTAIEEGATSDEATTLASSLKNAQAWYIYSVIYQKYMELAMKYFELEESGMILQDGEELVAGKYTQASWDATVGALMARMMDVHMYGMQNNPDNAADYYAAAVADIKAVPATLARFEASVLNITAFPVLYSEEEGTLTNETVDSRYVWQSPTIRPGFDTLEGFRITFLKSDIEGTGSAVNKELYNPIALNEIIIYDGDGNKLNITTDMITTNAQEHNEGPLSGLVDGTYDVDGNLTAYGDFYHSPWSSNYTWDPVGYVYFDITLPADITAFSVKTISRTTKKFHPLAVYIGEYGEVYDPIAISSNDYNASKGAQVTSVDEIAEDEVYLLQGIIKTNTNTEAVPEDSRMNPNWYAGRTIFHETVVREDCAYFIIKNSDGTFKIFNLKESKYLSAGGGLVLTSADAGNFNIVASTNADFADESTFVIYTDIAEPTTYTLSGDINVASDKTITLTECEVTPSYNVLMDWGPGYGVHSRACIDYQPGVVAANYGDANAAAIAELTPANIAINSAGDYLHFNKTSGEGEWKIYKMNMDNPYYYWTTVLVTIPESIAIGENPGQLKSAGTLTEDLAAAQTVISNNDYTGAKDAAKTLAATLESLMGDDSQRNPVVNGTYILEPAHEGFGRALAMYVDTANDMLKWNAKPASFTEENADCTLYIFEVKAYSSTDDIISDGNITEEEADKVFTIMNVNTGQYITGKDLVDDADQASPFLINRGDNDIFDIADVTIASSEHRELHCQGHGGGTGTSGEVVLWNGDANTTSASAWRLIKQAVPTSIESLVVEGDEVATVSYFTVGGAQIPAPVKGVNIVTIVYSNGVTETKKIIVE